jgi:hypothetical protein
MSDELLGLEEEVTTSWIQQVEALPKEAKKVAIRELLEYRDSENFKEVLEYCKKTIAKLNTEVHSLAYSREKCEATNSILDSYVATAKVMKDLVKIIDNETFKTYLTSSRISALDSAIMYKIGDPYGVPFDLPIHSALDILKTEASAYNSFENFLADCISHYDDKDVVKKQEEKKEESEEINNDPY